MIIQCEQCQTRFRLDDSKVTDRGVKVRCAKCKHVFTVSKGGPEEAQTDFGALLDRSASFAPEQEPASPFAQQLENPAAGAASETGFDYSDFVANDFSEQGEGIDTDAYKPPEEQPAALAGDDFSFSSLEGDTGLSVEQEQAAIGGVDLSEYNFGAGGAEGDKTAADSPFGDLALEESPETAPAGEVEDATAFTFGGEPGFGDTADTQPPGESAGADQLAAGMDRFAGTSDFDVPPTEGVAGIEAAGDEGSGVSEGSDSGGEAVAVAMRQAPPEEPEPAEEPLVAPQAEAPLMTEQEGVSSVETPEEEAPPLSIPSRRRQNPLLSVLIAVATVVVVAVLGFFGYNMFLEEKGKVAAEAGRITLRAVNATFVKNQAAGDLLVISGEAVNGYGKPRAAIQVKGMVYGADGRVLATKSAYCGNLLSNEQLAGMPLEKIEAAMANQFGDSLANLEVAPGKAIPFVIVIAGPAADAREYGVEPAGSTVATGKQ